MKSLNAITGNINTPSPSTYDLNLLNRGLSRWYRNVSNRVSNGETVNILCGVDSLTSGANGFSYIQPFRKMVQDALGDGGIGFQHPTLFWELGNNGVNYSGFTAESIDPDVNDDRWDGLSVESLYKATSGNYVTFNAGSNANINRETDEVDVYYLKFPEAATSARIYGFPSGPVFSGLDFSNPTNLIAKQTTTGYGKTSGWAANTVAMDQQNGPVRYLGFNFRRNCPTGGARVHFWAKGGTKMQEWASLSATSLQTLCTELDLDLAILNGGMNDRNDRTKAEFKTDVEKIITNFRTANPDIAILLLMPTIPTGGEGNLADYREALLELTATYDCSFYDTAWILGSNDDALAQGLLLPDRVHPSEDGFRLQAQTLFNLIGGSSLSQLSNTSYDVWAPTRDINAVSVGNWKPGETLPLSETSAPSDPSDDSSLIYMDSATGDLMAKINVGGTTKTVTIVDYSAS